ncbi:hypothetical protein MNBD_GAMMA20-217, partial [hydrothermal vent metagenome]
MANDLFVDMRQFFNFAIAREWIEVHPLAEITKKQVGGRQKKGALSNVIKLSLTFCLLQAGGDAGIPTRWVSLGFVSSPPTDKTVII